MMKYDQSKVGLSITKYLQSCEIKKNNKVASKPKKATEKEQRET